MGACKATVSGGDFKTLKGRKKGIFSKRYIHRGPESVVVSEKEQPLPGLCVFNTHSETQKHRYDLFSPYIPKHFQFYFWF